MRFYASPFDSVCPSLYCQHRACLLFRPCSFLFPGERANFLNPNTFQHDRKHISKYHSALSKLAFFKCAQPGVERSMELKSTPSVFAAPTTCLQRVKVAHVAAPRMNENYCFLFLRVRLSVQA